MPQFLAPRTHRQHWLQERSIHQNHQGYYSMPSLRDSRHRNVFAKQEERDTQSRPVFRVLTEASLSLLHCSSSYATPSPESAAGSETFLSRRLMWDCE